MAKNFRKKSQSLIHQVSVSDENIVNMWSRMIARVSIPYSSGLSFRLLQRLDSRIKNRFVSIPYSSGLSFRLNIKCHVLPHLLRLNPLFIRSQFQILLSVTLVAPWAKSQSLIHQVSVSDIINLFFSKPFLCCLNPLFIRSQFQIGPIDAVYNVIAKLSLNPLFIRSQFQIIKNAHCET